MTNQPPPPAETWREIYRCFDPNEPVFDPSLRAPRDPSYNRVEQLGRHLTSDLEKRRFIVTGGVGSGKTTELLQVARKICTQRLVVYIDLWSNLSSSRLNARVAFDHLQTWEVLGLMGLALLRAGQERFGHQFGDEPAMLQKALQALQGEAPAGSPVEIDVAKLLKSLSVIAGGALGGALAGTPGALAGMAVTGGVVGPATVETGLQILKAVGESFSWKWRLGVPGRGRAPDQDTRVQDVLYAVNAIVMSLQGAYARRLVLVIDGLDRVRDEATFEGLFVESSLLRELPCDLVVALDLALVERHNGCPRQFDRRFPLANVPVARADWPEEHGNGIPFFADVVRRRLLAIGAAQHPEALPEAVIARLAWCSGGRLRDFMRLVRLVAEEALMSDASSTDVLEQVVNEARLDKEAGLNRTQLDLLQKVLDDPDHRLPGDPGALELVGRQLLLAYPNSSTWYLPHPLLMLNLLHPRRRASTNGG